MNMNIKALQGRIKGCDRDTNGRLHILFGGIIKTWHLWTDDEDTMRPVIYHAEVHGESMEMPASPCIITFNEVTLEILGFTSDGIPI